MELAKQLHVPPPIDTLEGREVTHRPSGYTIEAHVDYAGLDPEKFKEIDMAYHRDVLGCDCKGCHPELWELDSRDIWIKKFRR